MEVYAASEPPLEGGQSADLIALLPPTLLSQGVASLEALRTALTPLLQEASLLLFVGAGDIDRWAKAFVENLPDEKGNGNPNKGPILSPRGEAILREKLTPATSFSNNESLADKTTLRIGGKAAYYAEPASVEDLKTLLTMAKEEGLPLFFLGRGSNLLVPEEGFPGLVIRLNHSSWKEIRPLGENCLWVGAGARLKQVCGEACKRGLAGFEFMEGIPASLGGALRMNAGAMGGWIFDLVEEVHCMTLEGVLMKLPRDQLKVGYRECADLAEAVAIGAILKAPAQSTAGEIQKKSHSFSQQRKATQPREPSSGCIFKNPRDHAAGQLIDALGLKGRHIGAAQVSEVHGNFIVNRGGATEGDVISLIKMIRHEVREHCGIELQPEVILMGKKWEEVL